MVNLVPDTDGPSAFVLLSNATKTASAKVYLFGAHIVSFVHNGNEKLWMSSISKMDGSAAIRGGIPIAWPQFADEGDLKLHGFAREAMWTVLEDTENISLDSDVTPSSSVTLVLRDNEHTRSIWPYQFELQYSIELLESNGIKATLKVTNRDEKAFTFSGCLHTYLQFKDTSNVTLHGFEGQNTLFVDKADGRKEKTHHGGPIHIPTEAGKSAKDAGLDHGFVDRIYFDTPGKYEFRALDTKKLIYSIVQSDSWTDTTIYNPWLGDKQGPKYPDFDDDGYTKTVCCEPTK